MANELVVNVSAETFETEVLKADVPILVDFWAPWCGPCRMVAPVLDELANDYAGKVKVCKVNVDDEGALALQYNVMSIPTIFVMKNGEMVERVTGAYPKAHFEELLSKVL